MNFLNPGGLWLLLLGLPLVALHFYRGRARRLGVPTLTLWEQVFLEEQQKSAFRRLRHRLSLFLNLFLLLVLTMAVAEPLIPGWNTGEKRWAFVIDTSPRMLARQENGRTGLEEACDVAREWSSGVGEVALYDGGGLVEASTKDRDRIQSALRRIHIRREGDAVDVARSLRETRPDVEVLLFTDHGGKGTVPVGSPLNNRGWVRGSWTLYPGMRYPVVDLQARRFGGKARKERIFLRWNGDYIGEARVELKEAAPFRVSLDPALYPGQSFDLGGVLEVGFEEDDSFSLDNVATFVLPATAPLPVILFHPDLPDPRLWKAIEGLVEAGLVENPISITIDKFAEVESSLGEAVVAIFDRCAPPGPLSRGAVLFFGVSPGWLPVEVGPRIDRPEIRDWDSAGPLFRGIDLTDLAVRSSRILMKGDMLIGSPEGAIAITQQRGGFASVVFGFPLSLSETDLTLRAAFPLFLRQWVEWIRLGGATRSFPSRMDWADPVFPTGSLWMEKGMLTLNERSGEQEIQVEEGRLQSFSHPMKPGPLRISGGDREEWVGVNAFHPEWSDLRRDKVPSPPKPRRPWYRDVSLPLACVCLALLLLLAEWFLYHRGWI